MDVLAQFLLRLSFGLAVGMALTLPRRVSSGYYRNHLLVILGLTTLAALVLSPGASWGMWLAATAAVISYLGSVCWMVDASRAGAVLLWLVAASSLAAAFVAQSNCPEPPVPLTAASGTVSAPQDRSQAAATLRSISVVTSGLLLGITMATMLLGHWYLNSPGMKLAPLRRLLIAIVLAVAAQMLVSAIGLAGEWRDLSPNWLMFVLLRWLFGLLGVLTLVGMAWKTLDIPNTQSATGILYVAVIGVFVGELVSLLLSAESTFPL
jgi:hypothetical protein